MTAVIVALDAKQYVARFSQAAADEHICFVIGMLTINPLLIDWQK